MYGWSGEALARGNGGVSTPRGGSVSKPVAQNPQNALQESPVQIITETTSVVEPPVIGVIRLEIRVEFVNSQDK